MVKPGPACVKLHQGLGTKEHQGLSEVQVGSAFYFKTLAVQCICSSTILVNSVDVGDCVQVKISIIKAQLFKHSKFKQLFYTQLDRQYNKLNLLLRPGIKTVGM